MDTNGKEADHVPPWFHVPADAIVQRLSGQIAEQTAEMAAMRVYIDQLHQALGALTKGNNANPVLAGEELHEGQQN